MDPSAPRTVSQMLNMVDSMLGAFQSPATRGATELRRALNTKEDEEALYLNIDMPGVGKENVKVTAEKGTLLIEGKCEVEAGEKESNRKYSARIELPPESYKLDAITAEMKNGVLNVVVPKMKKEEEKKDVFHVKID